MGKREKTANPHRGEVALVIDGRARRLRLSLGALAGLEARMGAENLAALVARFEGGTFRAGDLIALIEAGLEGAGEKCPDLASAEIEGGPVAAAQAAGRLLALTFAGPR
ncbi:gene transfer agent family protein [Roseobacter sp. HKCCA0434]|uniref:gene transfer agent family protein n=1 Tax=Roseobacter sp. HKCCA0434 TaxID=3079297 RepID=UPI002905CABE|nr:gene transfer agent family protein [Roseobacter sp. HKCCA0434]